MSNTGGLDHTLTHNPFPSLVVALGIWEGPASVVQMGRLRLRAALGRLEAGLEPSPGSSGLSEASLLDICQSEVMGG